MSLVDSGLDKLVNIYDSIRAIPCVLVVFFWVQTSSTHLKGAGLLTKWQFTLLSTNNQHTNGYVSICLEISKVYRNGLAMLYSLIIGTVYTNTFTFRQLKLTLGL